MRFSLLVLSLFAAVLLTSAGGGASVASASFEGPLVGDADCSRTITPLDALGAVQEAAGLEPDLDCIQLADVNCDGVVNLADMTELLREVAGLPAGAIPGDCPAIGSAAGLPPLSFAVDESMDVPMEEIPGINGGPARPVAGVQDDDGAVSLFVANEIVLVTDNQVVLDAFLAKWGGTLLLTIDPGDADLPQPKIHLIQVDPEGVDSSQLATDLREVHGDSWGQFDVSSEEGFEVLAAAASEAADGAAVDLNWVLEGGDYDQRQLTEGTSSAVGYSPNPFLWPYMNRGSNQDTGVADAWRALKAAGKLTNKVEIAILDGGFAPNDDFPASYEIYGGANIENPASCTGGSSCPWHGTTVTAAAMGVPNNSFGVAGPGGPVAEAILTQSPGLDLIQILGAIIDYPTTILHFPDIINISAGVGIPRELCLTGMCILLDGLTSGIRGIGSLLVVAAMNDGDDVDAERCINLLLGSVCYEKTHHIPCELAFVVCVGGLKWDSSSRHENSNYGTGGDGTVDIFGPYEQYLTPTPVEATVIQKTCGTSCASPFVAGVAALIKAANPNLSAGDLEAFLMTYAHRNGPDPNVKQWVNAYGSVLAALGGNEPPELEIELDSGSYTGGTAFPLSAFVSDPEDLPFGNWAGLPTIIWTSSIDGVIGNVPLTGPVLLSYGTHTITAVATDSDGYSITDTRTWNMVNYDPIVDVQTPAAGANLFQGQQLLFRGTSSDQNRTSGKLNDNEVQWYTAPFANPDNRTLLGNGHTLNAVLNVTPGDYLLTFKGTDDGGAVGEDTITIHVAPPPVDFPPTAQITNFNNSQSCSGPLYYEFTGSGTDPEDGTLGGASLAWYRSLNGGPEQFFGNGTTAQMPSSGISNGTNVHVILRVTDSANNTSEDFFDFNHACLI